MCGIAGIFDPRASTREDAYAAAIQTMTREVFHRGPDDDGVWIDPHVGIALGHRRLAVLDTSELGHQPMISRCGRYVLTYNGEVYNFRDLRARLERLGASFRGGSDSEVLLAAISQWGVRRALAEINGMFAFGVWDRAEHCLTLARDRMGEKPLYYAGDSGRFVFGSELRAVRAGLLRTPDIDPSAVALLFKYKSIPAPRTICRGVAKLPAGSFLTISGRGPPEGPEPYWVPSDVAARAHSERFDGTAEDAVDELHERLSEAVRSRMVADVPLGAFLSGGVDSSTVVALMQEASSKPVKTYAIGFEQPEYDESAHAKEVARRLGTEHTEHYVTTNEALAVVPRLPHIYDEPFADSSQVPTYLLSVLARKYVTVALTGDGGDELFGGYPRYNLVSGAEERADQLPDGARRALARVLRGNVPAPFERAYRGVARAMPRRFRERPLSWLAYTFSTVLSGSRPDMYDATISDWHHPEAVLRLETGAPSRAFDASQWPTTGNFVEQMMLVDTAYYLPEDVLVKVDRASMAASLEVRVPLLDPAVFEFAWRLPPGIRIGGNGKAVLRQLLSRYLPPSLVERPKMGFGVPLADWLRGPLREWAEDLLTPDSLNATGVLMPTPIRRLWHEHVSGVRNHQNRLWNVLMLQAWDAEYRRGTLVVGGN